VFRNTVCRLSFLPKIPGLLHCVGVQVISRSAIERPPKCQNPKKKKAKKSRNEPFFYPELRPKGSIVQEGIRPRDKNGPSEYL
jgi:hypothetical protein